MKTILSPWALRDSDFYKTGWHTRPTVGYELMFEFLRLSPSYELARKSELGRLSKAERKEIPSDFDQVLKTYQLLGDVQQILFRQWWIQRGLKVFGNPFSRPKVHKIALLGNGQDITVDALHNDLNNFLSSTRHEEGLVGSLLIAVPLNLKQSEIRKQLAAILEAQLEQSQSSSENPLLKLQGKRLRAKELFNGIRLLWFKAAKPHWEHWRLGAKARFSKTYSKVLNPENPRRVSDSVEAVDREMMTKITNRAIKTFETIAENAARGRFPSQEPVDKLSFDYAALAKNIQRRNLWEKEEKSRLLAVVQRRQS